MKKIKITCTKTQKKLLKDDLCSLNLYRGIICTDAPDCERCVKKYFKFKIVKKKKKTSSDNPNEKLMAAVKTIKSFCNDHEECNNCPFDDRAGYDCLLIQLPDRWPDFYDRYGLPTSRNSYKTP